LPVISFGVPVIGLRQQLFPVGSSKSKPKTLRVQFGLRLRALRQNAGLTQEEFAEKSAISVDFLSLIERGRNSPSFDNLESLSRALNLSVAELFTFEEDRQ
jgi:DNA-binding XRE family transcriptional regulator